MANKKVLGTEKAAILLLYLGEEGATNVFRNLEDEHIHKVSKQMSHLKDVTPEVVEGVLDEFSERMSSDTLLSLGGEDFVRSVLLKSLGQDKAQGVIQLLSMPMLDGGGRDSSSKKISVIDTLRKMDPEAVANLVRDEHPQTTSVILAHLEPEQVSKVIPRLPEAFQAEVVMRLGTLGSVPPGAMEEIEDVLRDQLKNVTIGEAISVGGLEPVAEMMNMIDRAAGDTIMETIEEKYPDLAEEIKNLMFVFDDLTLLDDRSMQIVLKEISNEDLTVALKGSRDEIKEFVFKNVSQRAAAMMAEDLEAMAPVRIKDVESAQQAILSVVRRLEGEGKVVIEGRGGEDLFV